MEKSVMKVAVINSESFSRNNYILFGIAKAFKEIGCEVRVLNYRNLLSVCAEWAPSVLLVLGGSGGDIAMLATAVGMVETSILWTSEDPYEIQENIRFSKLFHLVYTNDEVCVNRYKSAKYLPFAADKSTHLRPPRESSECMFDLFFVGTAWPERVETMNQLLAILPSEINIKLGLSGNPFLPDFHIGSLDLLTNFRLAPKEFASMANLSKVTLTMDRAFSANGEKLRGSSPPPRLFELAAAGTAQVYLTDGRQVERHFGKGIISCASTVEDAARHILALINNDHVRKDNAKQAYDCARTRHLYKHRIEQILLDIQSTQEKRPSRKYVTPTANANPRKRVLFVTHNVSGIQPSGGVEAYQTTIIQSFKEIEFLLLFWNREQGCLCLVDGRYEIIERFAVSEIARSVSFDVYREQMLTDIILRYEIDIVHFHHLIGHPLSLPIVVSSLGIATIIQMHDYYPVCNEFNLLNEHGVYCRVASPSTAMCDSCLSNRGVAAPGSQQRRRLVFSESLEACNLILHNVQYTRNKLLSVYPQLRPERNVVIGNSPQPATLAKLVKVREGRIKLAEEKLRVCVLGNFTREKGANLLSSIFWRLEDEPIEIHIIGRIADHNDENYIRLHFKNVIIRGEYKQEQLAEYLAKMDLSIHFSIWPETYCISVDEAWAAGVVPIVFGLGALSERVEDGRNGIVIDPGSPHDVVGRLRALLVDRAELERLRGNAPSVLESSTSHLDALRQIYCRYPTRPKNTHSAHSSYRFANTRALGFRFNNRQWSEEGIEWDTHEVNAEDGMPDASLIVYERDAGLKASSEEDIEKIDQLDVSLERALLRVGSFTSSIFSIRAIFPNDCDLVVSIGLPLILDAEVLQIMIFQRDERLLFSPVRSLKTDSYFWYSLKIAWKSFDDMGSASIGLRLLVDGQQRSVIVGPYLASSKRNAPPLRISQLDNRRIAHGETATASDETFLARYRRRRSKLRQAARRLGLRLPVRAHIDSVCGHSTNDGLLRGLKLKMQDSTPLVVTGWALPADDCVRIDYLVGRLVFGTREVQSRAKLVFRHDVNDAFERDASFRLGFEISFDFDKPEIGRADLFLDVHTDSGAETQLFCGSILLQ